MSTICDAFILILDASLGLVLSSKFVGTVHYLYNLYDKNVTIESGIHVATIFLS